MYAIVLLIFYFQDNFYAVHGTLNLMFFRKNNRFLYDMKN